MTTEAELLEAITSQPDDDVLRLAYADFVQETEADGEDTAKAIRNGLAFEGTVVFRNDHTLTEQSGFASVWYRRSQNFYSFDYWLLTNLIPHPQEGVLCEVRMHRGFPCDLTVPVGWWLKHGDQVAATVPALTVRLVSMYGDGKFDQYLEKVPGNSRSRRIRGRKWRVDVGQWETVGYIFPKLCFQEWPQVHFEPPLIKQPAQ